MPQWDKAPLEPGFNFLWTVLKGSNFVEYYSKDGDLLNLSINTVQCLISIMVPEHLVEGAGCPL